MDIEPEGSNIIKQDFFKYNSPYHPLTNNIGNMLQLLTLHLEQVI